MKTLLHSNLLRIFLITVTLSSISAVKVYAQPLSGTYTIDPSTGSYHTFTAAIADLNTRGVSAAVTFNVTAGLSYTEAPARITYPNPSGYKITFQRTGAGADPVFQPTANAGTGAADSLFVVFRTDNLLFKGIDFSENASSSTANGQMEFGFVLSGWGSYDGCQNDTLKNCTITLNKTNTNNTFCVYTVSRVTTGATNYGGNDNDAFINCTVQNALNGYFFKGAGTSTTQDIGNTVAGVTGGRSIVTNIGPSSVNNATTSYYGIGFSGENSMLITNTNINNLTHYNNAAGAGTIYGIGNSGSAVNGNTYPYIFSFDTLNNFSVAAGSTGGATIYGMYLPVVSAYAETRTGTITYTMSNGNVTGTGTLFTSELTVGTYIIGVGTVASITNNTNLVLTATPGTAATNVAYQVYNGTNMYNDQFTNFSTAVGGGDCIGYIANISIGNTVIPLNMFNCKMSNFTCNTTLAGGAIGFINNSSGSTNLFGDKFSNFIGGTGSGSWSISAGALYSGAIMGYGLMHDDTVVSMTGNGGSVTGLTPGGSSAIVTGVYNNYINNLTNNAGSVSPMILATSGTGSSIYNNIVSNLTATSTITASTLTAATGTVHDNVFKNFTSSGGTVGTATLSASGGSIYNNIITNIQQNGTGLFSITGPTMAGPAVAVYNNMVYNLVNASTTTGKITGMTVSSVTAATQAIYNNMIFDLRNYSSTATTVGGGIIGLQLPNVTTASAVIKLYDNTIYLNGTSLVATNTSSCLYIAATNTAAANAYDLRDNIFDNAYNVTTGTRACDIWYGTTNGVTLYTGINTLSNNNLYYVGTPTAKNLIMYDNTNSFQTLGTFQTAMLTGPTNATRDVNDVTGDPIFVATTAGAMDVHLQSASCVSAGPANNAGQPVIAVTSTDIDGNSRDASTPDIGADEVGGTYAPAYITSSISQFNCGGQTGVVFSVPTVTGATGYTWAVPSGSSITNGSGTNSITVTIGTTSGNVTVQPTGGCSNGSTTSYPVTITPVTLGTVTQGSIGGCASSTVPTNVIINLTGLMPSSPLTVTYTINGVTQPTVSVLSDGGGTGFFTVPITSNNNGQALAVTNIATGSCSQSFSSGNSVTLAIGVIPGVTTTTPQTTCSGTLFNLTLASNIAGSSFKWAGVVSNLAPRTGTITTLTSSPTVNGVGTLFTTELSVGSVLQTTGGLAIGTVTSITSNTVLTLTANASNALTAQNYDILTNQVGLLAKAGTISSASASKIITGVGTSFNTDLTKTGTITSLTTSPTINGVGTLFTTELTKAGTITATTSSAVVTGVGTLFLTDLVAGTSVMVNLAGVTIGTVASVQSNNQCTLTANAAVAVTGGSYFLSNAPPQILNLTTGVAIGSVSSITSNTQLTLTANGVTAVTGSNYLVTNGNSAIPTPAIVTQYGLSLGTVASIQSNTSLTLAANATAVVAGQKYFSNSVITAGTSPISEFLTNIVAPGEKIYQVTPYGPSPYFCLGAVAPIVVFVNTVPGTPGTIVGTATVCQGQNGVAYSVPAVTGATGYNWTLPTGGTIATGSNTNSITVNYSNTATSGNVLVQGTNTCGSGVNSAGFAVTVNPLPGPASPATVVGSASVVQGQPNVAYSVPVATNAVSYSWSVPSGASIIAGATTNAITVTYSCTASSGNITEFATNGCGNGLTSNSFAVTVNPVPNISVNPANAVCTGFINASLIASGATSYVWAPTTNLTPSAGTSVTETAQVSLLTFYTVTGTNSNGCTSSVVVPVATVATGGIISPNFSIICSGNTKTLTVTGAAGHDYQWQISPDNVNWTNIPGATNTVYTTASGDGTINEFYRLMAQSNTCWNVASTTAEVDISNPSIVITASSITDNNVTLSWAPTGTGNYAISYSGPTSATLTSVTPSKTITGLTANSSYSITVTQTGVAGTCPASGTISINTLCAMPTGVTLSSPANGQILVSWTGVVGADYRVYYRPLFAYNTYFTQDVSNASSVLITKQAKNNLYTSTTYEVYVSRLDCPTTGVTGQPTSPTNVTTLPNVSCATPLIDSVRSVCPVQIEVFIHDNGTNLYNIYVQRITPTILAVNSYGVSGTYYTINTPYAGDQYLIAIEAKCGGALSALYVWPGSFSIKPLCSSPNNLVLSNPTCHGFTASWNADQCLTNTASDYGLYLRVLGTINYNLYGVPLPANGVGPNKTINFITSGRTYQVYVRSIYNCNGFVTYGPSSLVQTISTLSSGCRDEETDQPEEIKPAVQQYSPDNEEVFSLYPNPSNGQFAVDLSRLSDNTDNVRIEVINMIGQTIMTHLTTISGGHMNEFINLPNGTSSGTYIVRLTAGKNVYTAKVDVSK